MNQLPHKHEKNRWILHFTMRCNYGCAYCIQKETIARNVSRNVRRYNEMTGDTWIEALAGISYRPARAIIMGGEPSLHLDFAYIITQLIVNDYDLDCTTNLSFNPGILINELKADGVILPNMWSTYHPEFSDPETYFWKVSKLRDSGTIGKLTTAYMDLTDRHDLRSEEMDFDLRQFHFLCGETGESAQKSGIRDQSRSEAFARKKDSGGNPITRKAQCMSSWVNVAPDGEVYNCAYHMSIGKNSFGNIRNLAELKRMPEYGEFFDCDDYGWCEACHDQSEHGGFRL